MDTSPSGVDTLCLPIGPEATREIGLLHPRMRFSSSPCAPTRRSHKAVRTQVRAIWRNTFLDLEILLAAVRSNHEHIELGITLAQPRDLRKRKFSS
jgi:hypothetical protein